MSKTGQAEATQSFRTIPGEGSIDDQTTPHFLLSSAEAAVNQALRPSIPGYGTCLREETTGSWNSPDRARAHTCSRSTAAPFGSLPPSRVSAPPMATFHALQEWEGHVVSIEEDTFVARLVDLTAGTLHESEEATIPIDEISDRDAAKMEVGSIFRWVIGYERSPEGTRKRVSQIVFRDLPRMTEGDLRAGRMWAGKIASVLNP